MPEHVNTGPFTLAEIEDIYADLMARGFYNSEFNAEEWNPEPYRIMGNILNEAYGLDGQTRVLDLGCGVGHLLEALHDLGVPSQGVEFSPAIYKRIAADTQRRVDLIDAEEFLRSYSLHGTSLLVAMEVFEHLPVSLTQRYFAGFREREIERLFLTIPTSGVDPATGRCGVIEGEPTRLADMQRNRPFTYIAMLNGLPGGGHITLASWRWWNAFLLLQGYVRDADVDARLDKFNRIFEDVRWCPYALRRLPPGEVVREGPWIAGANLENGGDGWWSTANSSLVFYANEGTHELGLHWDAPDPNSNMDRSEPSCTLSKLQFHTEDARISYTCESVGGSIGMDLDHAHRSLSFGGPGYYRVEVHSALRPAKINGSGESARVGFRLKDAVLR